MNYSVNNTFTHSSFPNSGNVNDKKDSKNELDLFSISDDCINHKVNSKYGFSQNHKNIANNDQIGTGVNPDLKFDLSCISKKDTSILGIAQKITLYDHDLAFKGKINESSCETSMKLKSPKNVTIIGYESKLKLNKDKCNLV